MRRTTLQLRSTRRGGAAGLATAGLVLTLAGFGCAASKTGRSTAGGAAPHADPSVSPLQTQAFVSYGGQEGPNGEIRTEQTRAGTEHAEATLSYGPLGDFLGTATAQAAFGSLRGDAVVAGRRILFPHQTAHTSAAFGDRLTFTGASGEGRVVYIYTLEGAASGAGLVGANVYLAHAEEAVDELAEYVTVSGEFTSIPHTITFGSPVDIRTVLVCDAHLESGQSGESACRFTLRLSAIRVFGATMQPLSGISVRSVSGTAYPIAAPGSE